MKNCSCGKTHETIPANARPGGELFPGMWFFECECGSTLTVREPIDWVSLKNMAYTLELTYKALQK